MKHIPLTRGYEAIVDDEDYVWLSKYKWHAATQKNGPVYARSTVYIAPKITTVKWMHREILGHTEGEVDHRDGNGLNNCRLNLRKATHSQNIANTKSRKQSSSKYKGVHWFRGKWVAQITCDGKRSFLGRHHDEAAAALAYDAKARELFGEFARTNF